MLSSLVCCWPTSAIAMVSENNEHDTERTPLIQADLPTPFPWRPASILFALNLVQPLAFELIFPFISEARLRVSNLRIS